MRSDSPGVRRIAPHAQRDQLRERAGGKEDRRFLAQFARDSSLELATVTVELECVGRRRGEIGKRALDGNGFVAGQRGAGKR